MFFGRGGLDTVLSIVNGDIRHMFARFSLSTARTFSSLKIAALATVALLAAALLTAAGLGASPAHADDAGASVTVSVTAGGEPVNGAYVDLYQVEGTGPGTHYTYVTVDTLSNGVVTFPDLSPGGSYVYEVEAPTGSDEVANDLNFGDFAQTWAGAATAYTPQGAGGLAATDGENVVVALLSAFSISGTVTNADGSNNGFQFAAAYRVDDSNPSGGFVRESYIGGGDNGTYTISGLRPGTYKIQYSPNDAGVSGYTWTGNKPDAADADTVTITDSSLTGVDATLPTGHTISGTLRDPNGNPAGDGQSWVSIYEMDGTTEAADDSVPVADGKFSFVGVPEGSYKLLLNTNDNGQFGDWYSDQVNASTATPVVVDNNVLDDPTNITANLSAGAVVTGTVLDSDENPEVGVQVSAITANGDYVSDGNGGSANHFDATTDSNGVYYLLLPPATFIYQVSADDSSFDSQYVMGTTSTLDVGAATQTSFVNGYHQQDINLLPATSTTTGTTLTVHVANKAGTSLKDVDISAEPVTDGADTPGADYVFADSVSGHSGTYTLSGLDPTQNYALYFSPNGSSATGTYAQYLGGAVDLEYAQIYKPTGSSDSLDVTLASNAAVSGVVTNSSNKPVKNVAVLLYKFDGANWVQNNFAQTSASGAYSFPNLATGSYTVEYFSGAPYVAMFAGGAFDPENATHVYVAPGKPAVLSAKLTTGGTISGTVAAAGGSKLAEIIVQPIALQGTPGHFTSATPVLQPPFMGGDGTSSTGKFTASSLATGYYALSYIDASGDYIYGDTFDSPVTNPLSTTPIYHVVAGKATAAGTVVLPLRSATATGTVSGSLDLSGGAEIDSPDGYVQFFKSDGTFVATALIQPDGSFSMTLEPGTYTYVATPFDDDNLDAQFADETGTVTTGDAPITVPVELPFALEFSSTPTVTDTSSTDVGTTYAVNSVVANFPLVDYQVSYQWFRGTTPIFGAVKSTYTSQGADLNSDLRVRVRLTDYSQNTATQYLDVANPVTPSSELYNTSRPTTSADATGQLAFGQTAHSTPGEWNNIPGLSYTYQWINCADSSILSSTATFTPSADEVGDSVRLEVQASKPGYTTPAFKHGHSFTVVLAAAPTVKTAPKVTSKTVGSTTTYTVTPGTWSVTGTAPHYAWSLDGAPVGTDSNSYGYATQPVGSQPSLTVTVTASKPGYVDGSTTVIARKGDSTYTSTSTAEDTTTGDSIDHQSDAVTFGDILTAGTSGISSEDTASVTVFSYQWQRATTTGGASTVKFANIAGGTHSTYTVGTADTNRQLRVLVTASSPTHVAQVLTEVAGIANLRQDLVNAASGSLDVISDSWQPGTKLVAGALPWSAAVKNSYQWLICAGSTCADPSNSTQFTAIKGATGSSYTPPFTMANQHISVRVIGSETGYSSATMYSLPQQIADGKTIIVLTPPTIASGLVSGIAKLGSKLTVKSGTYNVAGVVPTYQWQTTTNLSDWDNATIGTTYTVTSANFDAGVKGIRVVETAAKAGYSEPIGVTNASSVGSLALTATTLKVAPKVSLVAGSWVVTAPVWSDGATSNYAWSVDGSLTTDSTNTFDSSTVTAGDIVTVVAISDNKSGYQSAGATLVVQKAAAPVWSSPTVGGSAKFGTALTAPTDPAAAFTFTSDADGALSYQWYSASSSTGTPVAISKATASSFTPSTAYINKWISVKITLTSSKYATASHLTAAVQFVSGDPLDLDVAISGTPVHPGSKATAVLSNASTVSGQAHAYQWQTSVDGGTTWTNVSGATKSTYTVLAGDLGKCLRVVVTTTKSGYATATDPSSGVGVSQATVLVPTTQPTLTGNTAAGSVLTVNPGVWNVASTFTYQWYRDGDIIPGATGTTHTTTGDEDGENITVTVTAHSSGYNPVTVAPADIQVTDGAAPGVITAPKVTGPAALGATLTATSGVWSLDGLTITYQWYVLGSGAIDGATGNTFTVTNDQVGHSVYAVITVSRAGYTSTAAATNITVIPGVI